MAKFNLKEWIILFSDLKCKTTLILNWIDDDFVSDRWKLDGKFHFNISVSHLEFEVTYDVTKERRKVSYKR